MQNALIHHTIAPTFLHKLWRSHNCYTKFSWPTPLKQPSPCKLQIKHILTQVTYVLTNHTTNCDDKLKFNNTNEETSFVYILSFNTDCPLPIIVFNKQF